MVACLRKGTLSNHNSFLPSILVMNKYFLFVGLSILTQLTFGQNKTIENIRIELSKSQSEDTFRVNILNHLSYELRDDSAQRAYHYAEEARNLSLKINYPKGTVQAYGYSGLALWSQANFSLALKNLYVGLSLADSIHYSQGQADITSYLGLIYSGMADYQKALEYQLKSRSLQRQLKNVLHEVLTLNSI